MPAPLEEWATLEAGVVMLQELRGRALAIAGAARRTNDDRSSDVLLRRNTMMSVFHHLMDQRDVVQVRGYTPELLAATESLSLTEAQQAVGSVQTSLWVKHALPPSLNLAELKQFIQFVDIRWRGTPAQNVLRDHTPRGLGELLLSRQDRRRLRNRLASASQANGGRVVRMDGYINRWLRDDRLTVARQGSNEYTPAIVEELLFLDEEVLRPLLLLSRNLTRFATISERDEQQLQSIGAAAEVFGYQLLLLHDLASHRDYFVLVEALPKQRHWGTYVFRAGMASPYIVEVPRPLYERQTHQFGAALLERLDAAALLIAGAHPFANADGTSDVARVANKVNAFQLTRQVLLRELASDALLVVQTRAIQAPVNADLVVATDDGTSSAEQLSPLVKQVIEQMSEDGLRVQLVDGSPETAGYELGLLLQASSLNQSINKQMITLWLSPSLRQSYRDSALLRLMEAQFDAVGIPTVEHELYDYLVSLDADTSGAELSREFVATVAKFLENGDIMHLYRLTQQWPQLRCVRLIDISTDQAFLLVQPAAGGLPAVFNLDGAVRSV